MTIGIDLDDVLAAFNMAWLNYHNLKYGTNLTFDQLTTYKYADSFKIPNEIIFPRIFEFYDSEECRNIQPVEGSQDGISKLINHKLYVITARDVHIKENTINWIQKFFPNTFQDIVLTNQFTRDTSLKQEKKSDVCRRLSIDLLIDDGVHNAEEIAECGIKVLLLNKPWNQVCKEDKNIVRIKFWTEVTNFIS